MLTENTLVALALAGIVILLAIVFVLLAAWHDRAAAAAGPIEELAVYEKRLEEKQRLMLDLEEDLAKRREALAVIADIGAEVDGLRRQKEELLAEWESLRERREEVQAVRGEIEEAVIERQSLEAELVPLRQEFLEVKERLEKAEELIQKSNSLEQKHADLSKRVEALRDELNKLQDAEQRLAHLSEQERELERNCASLEGRVDAQRHALETAQTEIIQATETLAGIKDKYNQGVAHLAAQNQEQGRVVAELERLEESRATLEARLAYLTAEIDGAEGRPGTSGSSKEEKLKELQETPPVIVEMSAWPTQVVENETDALKRVERRLRAKGLDYPRRTLLAFHTAMKVNETTQMAVLAGISGTGKSQLPRQYAAGMGIGFLQVPVQPRWDSPQDLMGFYNYIEGKFRPTDMARALWALDEINNDNAVQDRMMMILLDEMNLARVEYYFSDFLSRLESRPPEAELDDQNARKDAQIELEIPNMENPPRIFPGYNLLFAGTMNEDESTQSLSDKVVDRANILRFAAPKRIKDGEVIGELEAPKALSRTRWSRWVKTTGSITDKSRVDGNLDALVDLMKDFKRPFGHRLGRAMLAYVANYPEMEGARPIEDALADQVEMRLLPKLRGVDAELAAAQFSKLRDFVDRELGDAALAEAIGDSVQSAQDTTGQFVWNGVSR